MSTRDTPAPTRPPQAMVRALRPGELIGGTLRIRKRIGRGRMGIVFEAEDTALRRTVAVKVPSTVEGAAQLETEGQALALLRHPMTVTVHFMGWDEGMPFLVMERVLGITLDRHIAKRSNAGHPYSAAEALGILSALADGLAAVHRAGIAHRDVKPANVMLCGTRVVLTDFGLVTTEYDAGRGGSLVGSPAFMAPEVIQGQVQQGLAHLGDVYSLGALAFELLTGRLPFGELDVLDTLEHQVYSSVPSLHDHRPDVPRALAELIHRMLLKDPQSRPDMDEVLWRVRRIRHEIHEPNDRPPSVVVVDNDAKASDAAALMGKWLPEGRIEVVDTAEEALTQLGIQPCDLIVIDLVLPKMSGLELCMYLRGTEQGRKCAVVVTGAHAAAPDVALLHQLGVTAFVPKGPGFEQRLRMAVRGPLDLV